MASAADHIQPSTVAMSKAQVPSANHSHTRAEDMQILWNEGVRMWDEYRQEHFTLRAIIFVTINDYPALFALLGQIKGKTTCVVCVDKIASVYLTGPMKIVYIRHRRFLMSTHKY